MSKRPSRRFDSGYQSFLGNRDKPKGIEKLKPKDTGGTVEKLDSPPFFTQKSGGSTLYFDSTYYLPSEQHPNWRMIQESTPPAFEELASDASLTTNGEDMARKFNDGDTVEFIKDCDHIKAGTTGIVRGFEGGNYAVEMESPDPGLHNCNGLITSGNKGWFVDVAVLELVPASPPRTKVDFDSVVIEDEKREQILQALEQVNQQDLIFKKWGFNKTIEKGRGVSMLFYGPPGTGKTLMAQAIADKLDYKLAIIAAADIMTSEPGGAERAIRKFFKEAKADKKTILLFDECDSIIFERTNVGVIQSAIVNELLSSLERFEGITVFTTNRLETLDEAVDRRLALKLEFNMPDQAQRAEIWKRMFPKEAPVAKDIDFMRLATVELAGGHIKNAVLRSARIAATVKKPDKEKEITMEHLVSALRQEGQAMLAFRKAKERLNQGVTFSPVQRAHLAEAQAAEAGNLQLREAIERIGSEHS